MCVYVTKAIYGQGDFVIPFPACMGRVREYTALWRAANLEIPLSVLFRGHAYKND